MSTTPARGFYYAAEARLLLSQDHAVDVDQSVVTQNLNSDFRKQKKRTQLIDCDTSWPSRVWELDIESTDKFREGFSVRRDPELPEGTVTIAKAADALGIKRVLLHALVYCELVPSVKAGEFRAIRWTWVEQIRNNGQRSQLTQLQPGDPWPKIQQEGCLGEHRHNHHDSQGASTGG